ncbi:MAG: beta-lactamase family protein [Gemmatimonadales bacterium]|nr:beta-lactamase family protein [Gemmatimonadales bacterium]
MPDQLSRTVPADTGPAPIAGECDPRFTPVLDTFLENFATRRELGAGITVYWQGRKVVDLWGGHADTERSRPFERDTLVSTASVVKGMMAMALHMLADQGRIDYDAPVARYWPAFAANGKERITVRQLISHHAALHFADASRPGDLFRWEPLVEAIAAQKPEWEPGTRGVYHTITIIPILGHLITLASGRDFLEYFRTEVTEGLGVDYRLGLGPADFGRFSMDTDTNYFIEGAKLAPELMARFFKPSGNPATDLTPDEQANIRFLGAGGTARGVARMFAFAAENGELEGKRIFSPRTIDRMTEQQWYEPCAVWGTPMRTALGLLLNDPDFFSIGPNRNAFGTAGAGGSFGMADRENRLAVGYALNRWWPALSLGDRARALIGSVYRSIL